jgi:hypothetical protein
MGSLTRHDIAKLKRDYGLRHFVETGTGIGGGLAAAGMHGFETLRSCEIDTALCMTTYSMYQNAINPDLVRLYNCTSLEFLARDDVPPDDRPALFWLDAHFPGADYAGRAFDAEPDTKVRIPLEDELGLIRCRRPSGCDVIICDDARIYVDAPFQQGNLPANVRPITLLKQIGRAHV